MSVKGSTLGKVPYVIKEKKIIMIIQEAVYPSLIAANLTVSLFGTI
jgi:hypothetical protein